MDGRKGREDVQKERKRRWKVRRSQDNRRIR